MKIKRIKIDSDFRALKSGFEIIFRQNSEKAHSHEPNCFVGLNGSGKSITLELICEIFYMIEVMCFGDEIDIENISAQYTDLQFTLEYCLDYENIKTANFLNNFILSKLVESEQISFKINKKKKALPRISITKFDLQLNKSEWDDVLPKYILGYSSGQNELISNCFKRLDFLYFKEFQKNLDAYDVGKVKVLNRMFYLDYNSNKMVLVSNLLFIDNIHSEKLRPLIFDKLFIEDLHSFTININKTDRVGNQIIFSKENILTIDKFKKCTTAIIEDDKSIKLIFYINSESKRAFKIQFKSGFELFKEMYNLRLLNLHILNESLKKSNLTYDINKNINHILNKPGEDEVIFDIIDIQIKKFSLSKHNRRQNFTIKYENISDGEHQLIQILGSIFIVPEPETLFIFDEPETHFNPDWRSKLIYLIMETTKEVPTPKFNRPLIESQEIFITSHSPFIISDCRSENVYLFKKTKDRILCTSCKDLRISTFGTSVNLLNNFVFNKKETIGSHALERLYSYKNVINEKDNLIDEINSEIGDSIEKILIINEIFNKNA